MCLLSFTVFVWLDRPKGGKVSKIFGAEYHCPGNPPIEAKQGKLLKQMHPRPCPMDVGGKATLFGETDARLIAKTLEGSEKAFRRLVDRHHPLVYSVVRGVLGDRDDVDDVVQEVLIKMYRGLSTFRGDARLDTWLYRIARNEAINAARRAQPPSQPVEETVVESPAGERPDAQYDRSETRRELEGYLSQLDEEYRVVLELRYLGEKSYAEIGEAMELPIGTVKSYIYRAKAELKRVMTKRTAEGKPKRTGTP
jgi:RNA polymerase sigma-70 factor (ECF subfamily)